MKVQKTTNNHEHLTNLTQKIIDTLLEKIAQVARNFFKNYKNRDTYLRVSI